MSAAAGPLHVVQVSWDVALLDAKAASDSRERQLTYTRLLDWRRPGSRMTIIVLGAPPDARPWIAPSLVVEPLSGRLASLGRLIGTLSRLHRKTPIHVVTTQSPLEEGWLALAWARGRVPVVAQVHFDMLSERALPSGSPVRALLGRLRRRIALCLLPRYAVVRPVAAALGRDLTALGARDVRAVPVPIFDLDGLRAIAPSPRPIPRILFVGRLAPEKNLHLWLDVARRVLDRLPAARFDIVGGGSMQPSLEARARALGLADAVTFRGPRTRAELPAHFAASTVLLLTSDHEGFGRVLIEAMAAGVAVVSTRTAGALDVIGDSSAGLLADIGDADALATAVLRLLEDPALHARTVAAGSAVAARFDPLRLAGAWVDMLIEAAERRSSSSRQAGAA